MIKTYFVFDVESIGLHGEGFAVAGGVYLPNGNALWEFAFSCPIDECRGDKDDRQWVKENVPQLAITHRSPKTMRDAFWSKYEEVVGAVTVAECQWPVEARFMIACIEDDKENRKWKGPYPFQEIASFISAAGMDPMEKYERTPSELPEHNPLSDSRLSARLLALALSKLNQRGGA